MAYDGEIVINTKLDAQNFNKELQNLGTATAGAVSGINMSMAGLSGGILAMTASAVSLGTEYTAQMSKVQSISGATAEQMALLNDKAKEMGASTKFSAIESGKAFEYMAMAGWDTQEMMSGISGIMSAAAASGEDLGLTADIITDSLTAFGQSADQASKFADILATTSAKSNTSIGMLGETFKYVAPVAGALKFSLEDVALASGLMANSGIKASQAGTALRATFSRLVKPTAESGDAMKALGLNITDAQGGMLPLRDILEQMRTGFDGFTEAEKASYAAMLGGQEAMSGLLAIVNASDEDFNALAGAIDNSTGSAEEMAKVMQANLAGQLEELGGGMETIGLTVSEALAPAISTAVSLVQGLVDGFNDLPKGTQEFIIKATVLTGVIGAAATAFKTLQTMQAGLNAISALSATVTGLDTVAKSSNTVATVANATAVKGLTAAMLASPLFAVAAGALAITAIITAVDYLSNSYQRQVDKIGELNTAYQTTQTELSDTKTELEGVNERILELQGKGAGITILEANELENLMLVNQELEATIRIKERLAEKQVDILQTETIDLLGEKLSAVTFIVDEFDGSLRLVNDTTVTLSERIDHNMNQMGLFSEKIAAVRAENIALAEAGEESGIKYQENAQHIETLTSMMGDFEDQLIEDSLALSSHKDTLNATTEDGKKWIGVIGEQVTKANDFMNGMKAVATGVKEVNNQTKDSAKNITPLTKSFEDLAGELKDVEKVFKDGKTTQAQYIESLKGIKKETDLAAKASPNLADGLKDIVDEIDNKIYEELIDNTKSLGSETKLLSRAMDENASKNGMTFDTILDLIDGGYAAAIMFDSETGAATLNKDMMIMLAGAKIQAQIASLEMQKIDLVTQMNSEADAAKNATADFWGLAQAKVASSEADKKSIEEIDAQIKALQGLAKQVTTYVPSSGGGGSKAPSGGGGGSKRVEEKKEEVSELIKEEVDYLQKQQDLNKLSVKDYYSSLQNMLSNKKLNTVEKKYLEDEFHKATVALNKETEENYIKHQEKLYDAEKQRINDVKEALQEKSYDEVSIVSEGSDEKLNIYSNEYLERIRWIDNENSIYSKAVNDQMSLEFDKHRDKMQNASDELTAELDTLSITNKGLYDEIMGLKDRNDKIREGRELKNEQKQADADAKRLKDLETEALAAEGEEREKILKQIVEFKRELSERSAEKTEQKEIAANNELIATKQKTISDNVEIAKTKTDEYNTSVEKTVDLLTKALETGNMGKIEIPVSFKGLDEGLAKLKEIGVLQTESEVKAGATETSKPSTTTASTPNKVVTTVPVAVEQPMLDEQAIAKTLSTALETIARFEKPLSSATADIMRAINSATEQGMKTWFSTLQTMINATMNMMLNDLRARTKAVLDAILEETKAGIKAIQDLLDEQKAKEDAKKEETATAEEPPRRSIMYKEAITASTTTIINNNIEVVERETASAVIKATERAARMGGEVIVNR